MKKIDVDNLNRAASKQESISRGGNKKRDGKNGCGTAGERLGRGTLKIAPDTPPSYHSRFYPKNPNGVPASIGALGQRGPSGGTWGALIGLTLSVTSCIQNWRPRKSKSATPARKVSYRKNSNRRHMCFEVILKSVMPRG